MRLLDVHTLELETFFGDRPPYAILSHVWEEEEVIFSDLKRSNIESAKTKKGYHKILKTCEQAKKDDFSYVWIDNCCIDKSSSSELSEAINSMFEWYKKSDKCYAYLADVADDGEGFKDSKWFTRAWTLQELLAPGNKFRKESKKLASMEFFSKNWISLGSKISTGFGASLSRKISETTGIAEAYLTGERSLESASISMRMSWAAERRATRAEDIAYSLLGVFEVNMPLLYGEGKIKAFRRLQEEIMKISEDETLFAWESAEPTTNKFSGDALASDPRDFAEAKDLIPFATDDPVAPYTSTHRGLRIWLQVHPFPEGVRPLRSPVMIRSSLRLHAAVLRCHAAHDFHHVVVIPLRHVTANLYVRDTSTNVGLLSTRRLLKFKPTQEIYIQNTRISSISNSYRRRFGFLIRNIPPWLIVARVWPKGCYDAKDRILQVDRDDQEFQSWHGSLEIVTYEDGKAFPLNHRMFLSLGCRLDADEEEPQAWYHLDDVIWSSKEGSLEGFHDSAFMRPMRDIVERPRSAYAIKHGFRLKVVVSAERVCGQRMFVVDIEYAERDHLGD